MVRCLALAEALVADGWLVRFACTPESVLLAPDILRRYPDSIADLPDVDGAVELVRRLGPDAHRKVDLMVVDGYGFGADEEVMLAGISRVVLAVDDMPSRPHTVDVLLDQTLGRTPQDYAAVLPDHATALCGSNFALLRAPFIKRRAAGLAPVATGERLRLLVNFGLTDASNATGLALDALAQLDVDVTVVLGQHAPHATSVLTSVARGGEAWRLAGEVDADTMARLIAEADAVIGAPGSASYERCCLARPSLMLVLADNQRPNAAALVKAGAACVLGDADALSHEQIAPMLARLLADRTGLRAMSEAAARVVDGLGAYRVAIALRRLCPMATP